MLNLTVPPEQVRCFLQLWLHGTGKCAGCV
jgi:hypothetical protein